MGYWSKLVFGLDVLPTTCFVFGGMIWDKKDLIKLLNQFDSAKKLSKFQPVLSYLVEKKNKKFLLCWGAYGSSSTMEIVKLLADGKCKNLVFIGWAYTPKNIEINSVIIPNKIRNLDGVTSFVNKAKFSYPSKRLLKAVIEKLRSRIKFAIRPCATVPYFFWQDLSKVYGKSKNYFAIDMEGSIALAYSSFYRMNSLVIFIITDSETVSLEESNKPMYKKQRLSVVCSLVKALTDFLD